MVIGRFIHLSFGAFLFLALTDVFAQDGEASTYTYKDSDRRGTGKVYMGREIAAITGFWGKDWWERNSRPEEENTALAIANLPITDSSVVADIGAGSGYYTFRIAPKVSKGKLYAVEVEDDAVKYLNERVTRLKLNHVEAIKGGEKSPNLPESSVDLVIMVDVYHELLYPHEMLQSIRRSLKPDGKLLLIEYRAEDPNVRVSELHKMTVEQVEKELSANGFHLAQNGQFMNIQHFFIFEKD